MREARIAARLHHPHAIAVYDVLEHAGRPCLIMEYLPSRSLADLIEAGADLPTDQLARIGSHIADALAAAHRAGIVHRDVKPANVLLAEDGTAKLTDFGISRAVGDTTVTATGILAGTPAFLAPEVAQGHDPTWRGDIYSLGATLYTAVEGAPPFGFDDNPMALLNRVASDEVPPPRQAGPLTAALSAMLYRDPERRPSARTVSQLLAAIADGAEAAKKPPSPRRRPPRNVPRSWRPPRRSRPPSPRPSRHRRGRPSRSGGPSAARSWSGWRWRCC
jgi:eukaryotic-like serine/threonine-protein kinase